MAAGCDFHSQSSWFQFFCFLGRSNSLTGQVTSIFWFSWVVICTFFIPTALG
ncbi:hypothetical protein GE21DRAFT_1289746 [Neurospora crassa]|nr:hypothetical protein GE21DRAFT_1289746 [Neurospora crassa]